MWQLQDELLKEYYSSIHVFQITPAPAPFISQNLSNTDTVASIRIQHKYSVSDTATPEKSATKYGCYFCFGCYFCCTPFMPIYIVKICHKYFHIYQQRVTFSSLSKKIQMSTGPFHWTFVISHDKRAGLWPWKDQCSNCLLCGFRLHPSIKEEYSSTQYACQRESPVRLQQKLH